MTTSQLLHLLDDGHRRNNKEKEIIADFDLQSSGSTNKYIPTDVTVEILSRLPIKSIGRFISVSKNWRDIITGRRFSSLHAKNKPFSTFYNITIRSVDSQFEHYAFEVDENGNSVKTTVRPRIDEPSGEIQIVGSCDGLLCLLESRSGFDGIIILNPITNERTVVVLPKHQYRIPGLTAEEYRRAGEFHKFGYSPSTDEYKVFKYVMNPSRSFGSRSAFAIFTVGVDQRWRELSPRLFSDKWMHPDEAIFCNGALHWHIHDFHHSSNHILAFDIALENTLRMPIRQAIEWHTRLSVFDNRVSLYGNNSLERPDQGNVVAWDTEGSWSQVVVPTHLSIRDYEEEFFEPLHCATKYGDVLLAGRRYGHIWLYSPRQERHTDTGVICYHGDRMFQFTPTIVEILYGDESSTQHNVSIDA